MGITARVSQLAAFLTGVERLLHRRRDQYAARTPRASSLHRFTDLATAAARI